MTPLTAAASGTTAPSTALRAPALTDSILQLLVLNAFVIAQPLLDKLAGNAAYIVEQRLSPAGLLAIGGCLLFAVPLIFAGVEVVVNGWSPSIRRGCHLVFVIAFCLCEGGLISRWLIRGRWTDIISPVDFVQALVAIATGGLLSWCLIATTWGPKLLKGAAIGLIIFPAAFVTSPVVSEVLSPAPAAAPTVRIEHPIPIVVVVFDGLCGTALMDEHREIDAVRYPSFARLAACSHWFRNATTVHPRTDHAVPAILSGRFPHDGTLPVLANYPQNLFTLLHGTRAYDCTIFEPLTRLAPRELEARPPMRSTQRQTWDALLTLQQVYWNLSLPENLARQLPDIPRSWFGLPDSTTIDRTLAEGLMQYPWDLDRSVQIDHFVGCLTPVPRPQFWFLHIGMPHYPFRYFPSGTAYIRELSARSIPFGQHGLQKEMWGPDELAVDQAWQRYLLQLGCADLYLGKILDRLAATKLLDEALVIVTADHGYSFRTNLPPRDVSSATLPDILPVPLFVKLPHQVVGSVSDRNVESIDILPTIADVTGLELPTPVDGESVFSHTRERLRKTCVITEGTVVATKDFPQADESRRRMLARFGSGADDRMWTVGVRSELVGKRVDDLPQQDSRAHQLELDHQIRLIAEDETETVVPCLFEGRVTNMLDTDGPVVLAIAIDGRIVAVTRTFADPEYRNAWAALVPEHIMLGVTSKPEIWEVLDFEGQTALGKCRVKAVR